MKATPRITLLAASLAAAFVPAHASEPEKQLEEVKVQSERERSFRSQTVQVGTFRDLEQLDVPLTANVITRPVIEAQGATTLYGALRNTAGVTRAQLNGATYDNLAIRGILVENRANYRLNGALPVINLIDLPLENKERVEVLKGASSLYYGFVPPSGIVNMVTKRAGAKPVTSVTVSANDHGSATIHGDVGRRFGEDGQYGLRVNVVSGREDIGVKNFSGERSLGAAAFDWRLTRDLALKLDVESIRKEVSEPAAIALLPAVNGSIPLPPVPGNRTNLAGEWQKYDAKADNVLMRLDYSINDRWGALFEAGRASTQRSRFFSQFQNYNLATGAGQLRIFFSPDQEFENENYRGEIYGRLETGSLAHDVSFGYTLNDRAQNARSAGAVNVAQNLFSPVAIPTQTPGALISSPQSIDDRGWYLFDRVTIGEQFQVMLGARASDYQSQTTTATFSAHKTTPQASLTWKPKTWLSLYGSYLEGLEESGQAPANRANAGEILPPALSKQRELGVKAEVARSLLLQAAYFEVERPSTFVDAQNRLTLNGMAKYEGFELAASGEIGSNLSVVASAILMDARQINRANASTYDKIPENTARRTGSVFLEWRVPQVAGLALNAGFFYTGPRPVDNANQAFIPGYTIASLGARYSRKVSGRDLTLQANLDNVSDKDYWSTAGNGLLGVGLPRTLRVSAKVDF